MNNAELLIKQEITETLYRYCRAMDRIDADLGYQTWHPDGTADYHDIFVGRGHEFIDWVCDVHRSMVATSHQITNILINVTSEADDDPKTATSESYVTVRLRSPDGRGGNVDIVDAGRYLDQWSCRNGRWALDHRDFVSDINNSQPVS